MKTTLIIMPGSPALVRGLAPTDTEGARLLEQVEVLIHEHLSDSSAPVDLVGSRDDRWYTSHTGSLRAWGAPAARVGGGNHLPELLQRHALGEYRDRIRTTSDQLTDPSADAVTLVAVDGPTGLTPRAPSSLVEGAGEIDHWCRALLGGEQVAFPSEQDLMNASLREPALWMDLVRLLGRVETADLLAADTSHGVGRYVAVWTLKRTGDSKW